MSEIVCPCCGAASPDAAKYCQNCGQPIICKGCGAAILAGARACIKCGTLIQERANTDVVLVGNMAVPPGYNHLVVHERHDAYSYDADFLVSNELAQQGGDFISNLVGARVRNVHEGGSPAESSHMPSTVEMAASKLSIPQLSSAPGQPPAELEATSHTESAPDDPEQALASIFRVENENLVLVRRDMKAGTQQEYTYRLVHLTLYAYQVLLHQTSVHRSDVMDVTEFAGLVSKNVFSYLARDTQNITRNNDEWKLKLGGIEHARDAALQVVDPTIKGTWLPSTEGSATVRPRKAHMQASDSQKADNDVAVYVSHEATQALAADIPHDKIASMTHLQKALVALYGLRKSGHLGEVLPATMARYLYSAFHVASTGDELRYALKQAVARKDANVAHRDRGYHITPSGERHVDDVLRTKGTQPTLLDQTSAAE
jgi:hypothetical protein